MKKILSLSLLFSAALVMVGCSGEEDDIFEASAAERLNAASELYSARLTAQPNGWAMQYYPTYDNEEPNGVGYLLLARFGKDHNVTVTGYNWPYWVQEFNPELRDLDWVFHYKQELRSDTSPWEVITDNGPVLSFNSYNSVMHYFSDPDYHSSETSYGVGFGGDYEFVIVEAPEDASYMILKGKKRATYSLLTPVEEGVVYEDYLKDVNAFQQMIFSPSSPISCKLILGDSVFVMDDAANGLPSIYPEGADKVTYESFNPFLITKRGDDYYLRFRDAFERDDLEGTLQDLRYVKDEDRFVCVENPAFRIEPYSAPEFLSQSLEAGHSYTVDCEADETEMSTKVRTCCDAIRSELTAINKKYIFKQMTLRYDQESKKLVWGFAYQNTQGATKMEYTFEYSFQDKTVTTTYSEPLTVYANNMKTRVQNLATLMETLLSQQFTITGMTTEFDLSKIKLTSVADPDIWFILNY